MNICDVHGEKLSEEWKAEFRGFFLGEGSIEISRYTRGTLVLLRPRLRITQRADNRKTLDAIAAKLGGHVTGHAGFITTSGANGKQYKSNPQLSWQITSRADVLRVVMILRECVFPHRKLDELFFIEKYLQLSHGVGHKYTQEEHTALHALKKELQDIRNYSEC